MSESTSGRVTPRTLRVILALSVGLEAVVTAGYGVLVAVLSLVASAQDRAGGVVLGVSAAGLGIALGLAAVAARRGRGGVRTPLVVWQVMQLSVAYLTIGTPRLPLGIALAVLAVVTVVCAAWPGVLGAAPAPGSGVAE